MESSGERRRGRAQPIESRRAQAEHARKATNHLFGLVEQDRMLDPKNEEDLEALACAIAYHGALSGAEERQDVNTAFASLLRFGLLPENMKLMGEISWSVLYPKKS